MVKASTNLWSNLVPTISISSEEPAALAAEKILMNPWWSLIGCLFRDSTSPNKSCHLLYVRGTRQQNCSLNEQLLQRLMTRTIPLVDDLALFQYQSHDGEVQMAPEGGVQGGRRACRDSQCTAGAVEVMVG